MTEFRGNLYIFVDKTLETPSETLDAAHGDIFSLRGTGEMLWFMTGWAVGRNTRGTYCSRTSLTKMLSFDTFASAMDCVRKFRKARPHEFFYLVYAVDGRKSIITTLEQIQRTDDPSGAAHCTGSNDIITHALELLAAKVGKILATNALLLLEILTEHGEDAARERFSNATYDRLWRVLREANLVS